MSWFHMSSCVSVYDIIRAALPRWHWLDNMCLTLTETIFPRIYARMYDAPPRALPPRALCPFLKACNRQTATVQSRTCTTALQRLHGSDTAGSLRRV